MKFAHMSDIHLGSWSAHPELREKACDAFDKAADICIQRAVDFIVIAGDLFDTSMPSMDVMRRAFITAKKVHDNDIKIYVVPGSHDFSPTGKTAISLLEAAGFVTNVAKIHDNKYVFVEHKDVVLTGMVGRKGSLEHEYFDKLQAEIPDNKFSIFVFHSAIHEYKPKHLEKMAALPLSSLPEGFDYYANGHVHIRFVGDKDGKPLIFPGTLFPTEFTELEKYDSGFYIVDTSTNEREFVDVKLFDTELINVDAEDKTASEIEQEIIGRLQQDLTNKAVLIKVKGVMKTGRVSDINFQSIQNTAFQKNAFTVKKNFHKLSTKDYDEVKVDIGLSVDKIEEKIIAEHSSQKKIDGFSMNDLAFSLTDTFSQEKREDETNAVFEKRLKDNALKILKLDED